MCYYVESSWNVMAHGDAQEGKWRGNWRMEWVASTLYTTSEHGVSSINTITTADVHTSAASRRLNWRPSRFKWTRPFRRKMKSGFCACAITFQTQSTTELFYCELAWCVLLEQEVVSVQLTSKCASSAFFNCCCSSMKQQHNWCQVSF